MTGAKRITFLFAITFASLIVQEAVFGLVMPRWLVPNFVVLIALFLGLKDATISGAMLAFAFGLIADFVSAQAVGPLAGAAIAVFGIFSQIGRRLLVDNAVAAIVIAVGGCVFGNFVSVLLLEQFSVVYSMEFWKGIVGMSLITAAFSPVLFSILERFTVKKSHPLIGKYF